MTKTKRTNQYERIELKKKDPRTFKTIFDMFTSDKLSINVYYNNLKYSEGSLFCEIIRKNPNKYLGNIVLSSKQSKLLKNVLYIDTCKEQHCNKYYKKCYDCSYNETYFGCLCKCKGCYDTTGICSICMLRIKSDAMKLDCAHIFHKECIDKWVTHFRKTTCPYCRTTVNQELFRQPLHITLNNINTDFELFFSYHRNVEYLNPTHIDL